MYSYIRIFSDTNIRSYHIRIICLIRIYLDIRSYHFFIRLYSDIHSYHFFNRIYSDICSYRFLDINIFKYSFVSKIYIYHNLIQTQSQDLNNLICLLSSFSVGIDTMKASEIYIYMIQNKKSLFTFVSFTREISMENLLFLQELVIGVTEYSRNDGSHLQG